MPPIITLDNETSIYTVKVGRELEISPSYENIDDATFRWTLDGTSIGDEPSLRFSSEQSGRYYITLTVTNKGGMQEEELRVDVLELTPPTITLPEAHNQTILAGSELDFKPQVASSLETSYLWTVDGKEVSTEQNYVFIAKAIGDYVLRFVTQNEDGEDSLEFNVMVREASDVDFKWTFEQTEYNVAKDRRIRLRALDIENAFNAVYTWTLNGKTVQQGDNPEYIFQSDTEGTQTIKLEMRNEYLIATQILKVNVCPKAGTYYRAKTASSLAVCNKVFEYTPAPGQFINEYYTAANMVQACAYAEERMAKAAYVSLGGFGGYIIVGFDHSIDNDESYNIAVTDNAFDGSSEPGIVWVMQDENGDGLPNDTWYELKGSEYGKSETIQDYAVTYYRPTTPKQSIPWKDNQNNTGSIEYLGSFHTQDCYYPTWVEADSYTLRGTCLKSRSYDASGNGTYWVNPAFDWGYADNFSAIDRLTNDINYNASPVDNHFKISNAVTFDGKNANLKYIDFVKIQVGLNVQCGWIGEVSTEIFSIKDFNIAK